jgi:hypothetical protein
MTAPRVLVGEPLWAELNPDEEVRRHGRTAVIRRAIRDYRKRRGREAIARP